MKKADQPAKSKVRFVGPVETPEGWMVCATELVFLPTRTRACNLLKHWKAAANSKNQTDGYPIVTDVKPLPLTPQRLLRTAASILDRDRECAKESAIWRIQLAMKMLRSPKANSKKRAKKRHVA